jgi:hypothetical protein
VALGVLLLHFCYWCVSRRGNSSRGNSSRSLTHELPVAYLRALPETDVDNVNNPSAWMPLTELEIDKWIWYCRRQERQQLHSVRFILYAASYDSWHMAGICLIHSCRVLFADSLVAISILIKKLSPFVDSMMRYLVICAECYTPLHDKRS